MRIARHAILLLTLTVVCLAWQTPARANAATAQAAQGCPAYGGWILYRMPAGGSGGLATVYTATHGDCVGFFTQHPDYVLVDVTYANPKPSS